MLTKHACSTGMVTCITCMAQSNQRAIANPTIGNGPLIGAARVACAGFDSLVSLRQQRPAQATPAVLHNTTGTCVVAQQGLLPASCRTASNTVCVTCARSLCVPWQSILGAWGSMRCFTTTRLSKQKTYECRQLLRLGQQMDLCTL
jgi:hypothetical protein